MRFIKYLLAAAIAALPAVNTFAVTDKEMDEAKAITAKEYLRWVNDGSGYLDDFSVKSMSELNSKLKAKEKENIAAFNAVQVPSDYASWDKAKLIEYWSSTFFNSSGLDAKGKGAKARVRKKLEAMTVSAPSKEPVNETPEETKQPEPETTPPADQSADNQLPTAEEAVTEQQDILADQEAIQKDAEDMEEGPVQEQSHTWVYVLVLVILVAVVIWLVVYAANLMKRQPAPERRRENDDNEDDENLREQTRIAIAKKNEEIKELHERLHSEEEKSATLGLEIERMKLEHSRLLQQLQQLREQNNLLTLQKEKTQERVVQPEPARHTEPEPVIKTEHEPVRKAEQATRQQEILNVIYLGRTNRRGIFVRADRRINPGNTIYRLDTNDGLVGTFKVVDTPEVVELALSNPEDYLSGGCMGEDLQDTAGVTRILTVSAGTAIFENGYWKVLRKTSIRYE